MVSKQSRSEVRVKKHARLRNRFAGTAERPGQCPDLLYDLYDYAVHRYFQ